MLLLNAPRYESAIWTPASISGLTGWWESVDSANYTKSGSEITQLNDLSGNGNHFTVPGGKTGPDEVTISGVTWMDFPVSGARVMSVTNSDVDPGAGDFTFAAVYRAVDSGTGPGCIFGKAINTGEPNVENYGIFCGVSNSRSLYFQMRDTVLANTQSVEHDDVGTDYTDGTTRYVCVTYDDSEADLYMYGSDFSSSVASDLTAPTVTISPSVDLFLGDWSSSYDRAHEGELLSIVCYDKVLDGTERGLLEDYFDSIIV
jgi:hypothetical protein